MAPLILHNVPDDELYVGEDGKQRPYAMVFPHNEGHHASIRGRRPVAETGSFGKSARRSRSKTATPARREDPTIAAADKVFTSWFEQQRKGNAQDGQRKSSGGPQSNSGGGSPSDEGPAAVNVAAAAASAAAAAEKRTPVEVILRGFRSQAQQYAAIDHYEILAGNICEDYPRHPPVENRRYKSELRDPAYHPRRALTPEERVLVNRADGGEHWIKVTFESAAAADAACLSSPQLVLGHLVYAEPYHGMPPARDEAIPQIATDGRGDGEDPMTLLMGGSRGARANTSSRAGTTDGGRSGKSFSTIAGLPGKFSPSNSHVSSLTADTGTLGSSLADTITVSSATVTGDASSSAVDGTGAASSSGTAPTDSLYCRKAPTVRRATLRPAEQALLPQTSYAQRALNRIPFLKWFSGSMIGNEVPRTDMGEFDWDKASLYWKFIWWLDATFRLFGGEIINSDKDD